MITPCIQFFEDETILGYSLFLVANLKSSLNEI